MFQHTTENASLAAVIALENAGVLGFLEETWEQKVFAALAAELTASFEKIGLSQHNARGFCHASSDGSCNHSKVKYLRPQLDTTKADDMAKLSSNTLFQVICEVVKSGTMLE